MGKIVAGLASSHAIALADPSDWDRMRDRASASYERRHGIQPPVHPRVAKESVYERHVRYKRVKDGFEFLREKLKEKKPDVLILVGDDQNEHFKESNVPQIAIYLGDEFFVTERRDGSRRRGARYGCRSDLARGLLDGLIEREFDVSFCRFFPDSELIAHAFGPILTRIVPEADIPVVPVFVNAIHVPSINPRRCYQLGEAIKQLIEGLPSNLRVAVYASGGLSHFTGSYPWAFYKGPYTFGCISEEFDRSAIELMARGEGERLAQLTSRELLDNGDVELRSWIVLLGGMGNVLPQLLIYEPFYSGIMGMGVAYWELEDPSDNKLSRETWPPKTL